MRDYRAIDDSVRTQHEHAKENHDRDRDKALSERAPHYTPKMISRLERH